MQFRICNFVIDRGGSCFGDSLKAPPWIEFLRVALEAVCVFSLHLNAFSVLLLVAMALLFHLFFECNAFR